MLFFDRTCLIRTKGDTINIEVGIKKQIAGELWQVRR